MAKRWQKSSDLMGKSIKNAADEDLGTVKDIVVDADTGRILYGVVSFGGFLGMGDKLFAVPWPSMRLAPDYKHFVLDVPKEQLKKAEGFDKQQWPDFADERWATRTYETYGQKPYWTSSDTERGHGQANERWSAAVVKWQKVSDLDGMGVDSATNEDVGEMENLAIDPDAGRVMYGILDHGNKLYAIPWNAIHVAADNKRLTLEFDSSRLDDSVAFTGNDWPNLADERWAMKIHRHYGVQPYWASTSGMEP